jgi:hypothetical protein
MRTGIGARVIVYHYHEGRMSLENVIRERNNHDDSRWRGIQ